MRAEHGTSEPPATTYRAIGFALDHIPGQSDPCRCILEICESPDRMTAYNAVASLLPERVVQHTEKLRDDESFIGTEIRIEKIELDLDTITGVLPI